VPSHETQPDPLGRDSRFCALTSAQSANFSTSFLSGRHDRQDLFATTESGESSGRKGQKFVVDIGQ